MPPHAELGEFGNRKAARRDEPLPGADGETQPLTGFGEVDRPRFGHLWRGRARQGAAAHRDTPSLGLAHTVGPQAPSAPTTTLEVLADLVEGAVVDHRVGCLQHAPHRRFRDPALVPELAEAQVFLEPNPIESYEFGLHD